MSLLTSNPLLMWHAGSHMQVHGPSVHVLPKSASSSRTIHISTTYRNQQFASLSTMHVQHSTIGIH